MKLIEPEPNLYPGPMEHTVAGPQVSMVDLDAPDLERYPRYAKALSTARVAELGREMRSIFLRSGGIMCARSLTSIYLSISSGVIGTKSVDLRWKHSCSV